MTYINPRTKLFQHMDRLAAIQAGGRPAPVNVEIDLSNRCDLKCAGCHFAYTHTRGPWAGKQEKPHGAIGGGDLMDYTLALSVVDQLAGAGVRSVTWTGGGEPTLHPDFEPIVSHAAALGLEQGIYTHGGHIHPARAALLKESLTWVYISLDACTRESYREHKGVDRFDKVCANVRGLVAAEGTATVGLGYLLHSSNYMQVPDMVALGKALGVDYVQFRPLILYSQDNPGALAEDTTWITWAVKFLRTYERDPFVIADVSRFQLYRDWTAHGYPVCYGSALQTVITPNGKVWRCTNKREHPDALLGDLRVDSFENLWKHAGGPCAVDGQCRVFCRQHIANLTLNQVMTPMAHGNFI